MTRKSILVVLSIFLFTQFSFCEKTQKYYHSIANISFDDTVETAEKRLKAFQINYTLNATEKGNTKIYEFKFEYANLNDMRLRSVTLYMNNGSKTPAIINEAYNGEISKETRKAIVEKYGLGNMRQKDSDTCIYDNDKYELTFFDWSLGGALSDYKFTNILIQAK